MATAKSIPLAGLIHRNVLVRVPNWVGDAVLALPALRALRQALPAAQITLLARPWVADVFPLEELRMSLIPYDTQREHRGLGGKLRIAARLRREQYDLALLLQNAFDAAFLAWLARIPARAGYARDARRVLLTHPAAPPRRGEIPRHETHYYLELLKRLGLIAEYPVVTQISLRTDSLRERGRARLMERVSAGKQTSVDVTAAAAPLIGLSPGATFGTAKRWPAERYAALVRQLHEELGAQCVLFGSSEEAPLASEVAAASQVPVTTLAGKTTLAEFVELISGCDAYVTNDTGTMHVAAALGVPTIALFGPTNEHETAPLGPRAEMIAGVAECRPCKLRHCPIDHRCMTSISPDAVLKRVRSLLQT